jgi:hypothetical protein
VPEAVGFSMVLALIEFLAHPMARETMRRRQQDAMTRYLLSFFLK